MKGTTLWALEEAVIFQFSGVPANAERGGGGEGGRWGEEGR